jgi:hypothetical protein
MVATTVPVSMPARGEWKGMGAEVIRAFFASKWAPDTN